MKTRAQRALACLLVCVLFATSAWAYFAPHPSHPASAYFFSADGSQIDVRSPNGRLIVDVGYFGTISSRQEIRDRCDFSTRKPPLGPIGATYRGVELCNSTNSVTSEFEQRNDYFRWRVDELYSEYHRRLIEHYGKHVVVGFAAWIAALLAWFAFKWVRRGLPSGPAKAP